MKKALVTFSTVVALLFLADTPMFAQRGRGGSPGGGVGGGNPGRGNSSNAGTNRGNSANPPAAKPGDVKAPAKDKKPENKVGEDIHLNPKLEEKVKPLLPPNMALMDASDGFKNRGQFIAALHVSRNLGIPFGDLKAKMTGEHPLSLGKSVEALKPDLGKDKAEAEAKRAEKQAKEI